MEPSPRPRVNSHEARTPVVVHRPESARTYLREHTAGSLVRSALEIHGTHFTTLFLIYFLPFFSVTLLQHYLAFAFHGAPKGPLMTAVTWLFGWIVNLFAYSAMVVAVSDICIGNKPGVRRSYRKILGPTAGRLLVTAVLQSLVLGVGLALLIVPGIIFWAWYMFAPIVVVLEGRWGPRAMGRSKSLGKGSYARTAGVLLLMVITFFVVESLIVVIAHAVAPLLSLTGLSVSWLAVVVRTAVTAGITGPIMSICLILLYYSLRVRKEAYDPTELVEELRH